MRVNRRELALWSFLMSSAHGAGLMVAPVLLGAGAAGAAANDHARRGGRRRRRRAADGRARAAAARRRDGRRDGLRGRCWSTTSSGVAVLRKAWINLDGVWAGAFVLAGVLTLFT